MNSIAYEEKSLTGLASVRRDSAVLDVIAVAALVALCAQVRIPLPFTPIPVTLQTLAVLMVPFAVGPTRATAGMMLFAIVGLLGVPVFALSFGPTFGYILGFIAVPAIVSRFRRPALGLLAGTAAIYALGVAWLCMWTGTTSWQVLLAGVAPFLPADAIKAAIAYRYARSRREA